MELPKEIIIHEKNFKEKFDGTIFNAKDNIQDGTTFEIYLFHTWFEVNYITFRSWCGQRRVNGNDYEGPVYIKLSNKYFLS